MNCMKIAVMLPLPNHIKFDDFQLDTAAYKFSC